MGRDRSPILAKQVGEKEVGKMARIKTSSAKNKGRRLQQWACQKVSEITGLQCGKDSPIESRGMGQNGVDVRLDDAARSIFPFSVECKCQESWSIHAWIDQARKNIMKGTDWLLIASRNRAKPVVVMDAEVFFKMAGRLIEFERGRKNIPDNNPELPVPQTNVARIVRRS